MTANYQSGHSGGRANYDSFWAAIDRVTVSNVTGTPPGSAQALVTYYYKSGKIVDETTSYGLVEDGGTLKIDSSTVLSSHTR